MRCPLLISLSVMVLFLLGVGAAAAAGRRAAGDGDVGKAKAGLGATGSDIITITSKNFKETVRFAIEISKYGGKRTIKWWFVRSVLALTCGAPTRLGTPRTDGPCMQVVPQILPADVVFSLYSNDEKDGIEAPHPPRETSSSCPPRNSNGDRWWQEQLRHYILVHRT